MHAPTLWTGCTGSPTAAITTWEQLNAQIPHRPLHWPIAHAVTITPQDVQRLKALGGGPRSAIGGGDGRDADDRVAAELVHQHVVILRCAMTERAR